MFSHIDPRYIDAVWPKCEALLAAAVAKAKGEITIEQLRLLVVRGDAALVVWHEDDVVKTACTVEFINYPNYRVAYCSFTGGDLSDPIVTALKEWAAALGASHVQCWCGDAESRLFARFGFEKAYNVMRMPV